MGFRNVSLRSKLYGLVGVLVCVVAAESVLQLSGQGSNAIAVAGLVLAVICALIAIATERYVSARVAEILTYVGAAETATRENLGRGLEAFANGDLTVELHARTTASNDFSIDEFGRILRQVDGLRGAVVDSYDVYNRTAATLRDLLGHVSATAKSVDEASRQMAHTSEEAGNAATEIANAVGDVAQGAERQVQMIAQAKAAAEETASAVQASAENAERAAETARETRELAHTGVDAAEQANAAMHAVEDSSAAVTDAIRQLAAKSDEIGEIVQTITGLADQTNLLALNAAIEAARAGEQGRGFAVVADEVRKLAEGSQRAAKQISELIGTIQAETASAVKVVEDGAERTHDGAVIVEQARDAFRQIEVAIDDMSGRIEQIAAASQEIGANARTMQQSLGEVAVVAEQSSAATQEVSASTEQTSASTEQIAASAQTLAGDADSLNALIAKFNTGQ